jgi:hypothetical protein
VEAGVLKAFNTVYPPRILGKNITGLKLQPLVTTILTMGFLNSLRLNVDS